MLSAEGHLGCFYLLANGYSSFVVVVYLMGEFFFFFVMGRDSPPHGLGDLSFPNRGLTWKRRVLTTALPGISQEKLFWHTWFVSSISVLGHQSNMVNKVKKEPKPSGVLRMEVLIQMACKFENYEKRDWGSFWSSSAYLLFMVCFFCAVMFW